MNRNTQLLLSILGFATLLLASCSGNKQGISGVINGANGETIYLEKFEGKKAVKIDSATIDPQGKFHIAPSSSLKMDLYRLTLAGDDGMFLMTDSTEALSVVADADSLSSPKKVSGSTQSEYLQQFKSKVEDFNVEISALKVRLTNESAAMSKEDKTLLNQKATELQDQRRDYVVDFLEQHKEDAVSLAAVTQLNIYNDLTQYVKVRDRSKENFAHTYYYTYIDQEINKAKASKAKRQGGDKARQEKNNKYKTGMEAPDIVMGDVNGKTRKLSDLKGKVVLIDFWASWCGPCRRENPNVVKAYEQYKKDGFEVFSVSLDKQQDRWEKAIDQDKLIWPNHVCDFKGWQNEASNLYGISSIPHTILVGRDGKIVATKLRGAALDAKLEELFKG